VTCPDCSRLANELAQVHRYWQASRRRYQALHAKHEYLYAAWQNECVINERLRRELRNDDQT
jgi:hypothetical protein